MIIDCFHVAGEFFVLLFVSYEKIYYVPFEANDDEAKKEESREV